MLLFLSGLLLRLSSHSFSFLLLHATHLFLYFPPLLLFHGESLLSLVFALAWDDLSVSDNRNGRDHHFIVEAYRDTRWSHDSVSVLCTLRVLLIGLFRLPLFHGVLDVFFLVFHLQVQVSIQESIEFNIKQLLLLHDGGCLKDGVNLLLWSVSNLHLLFKLGRALIVVLDDEVPLLTAE